MGMVPASTISHDPVAKSRRTTIVCGVLGGVMVGLAATWCFWPVDVDDGHNATPDSMATERYDVGQSSAPPFDLAAFEAPLWTAPPPIRTVAAPAAPPPPPPPLKLQLLGIFRVDKSDSASSYRALLYDPDQDKVVIVASGDSIAQRTVDSIDRHAIALRDTAGVRTLALRGDQPPAGPESSPSSASGVKR